MMQPLPLSNLINFVGDVHVEKIVFERWPKCVQQKDNVKENENLWVFCVDFNISILI